VGESSDLGIDLRAFPLSAAAIVAPGFAPEGSLSGTIRIGGPKAAPVARYELAVSRFTSDELDAVGAGPVAVTARGTATLERIDVTATLSGPARSTATVRGVVPLSGAGLALDIKGAFDLGIANALIAARGMRVSGPVSVDLAASGSLANPRLAGSMRLTGGRFEDPVNGMRLDRIALSARAEGDVLTVTQLSGSTVNGGTLTGSGSVTLRPDQGFPGRFELRSTNAQLVSSEIVTAVADARLEISGEFARRPRLSGRIDLRSMEVKIPDRMPGAAARIDVRHVNVPSGLRRHLPAPPRPRGVQGPAFRGDIDLVVAAPVRVFVRGRGVDAEFGGELAIRGDTDAPTVTGGFGLKRGTVDLLRRRLNFTRGRITFANTLDPTLDFVSETRADGILVAVNVTGTAAAPKFEFKSTPELPQDEVVARLLFGRPSAQLTTSQAVRLAQAVAQLSGGGDSELLDRIRRNLGVDTIDVGGDETGAPRLGLGRRINDRVYLGVTQGATPGSSGAKVRVDITPNVRVESEVGTDRSNSIGIGAEWDY
jgi:translocation and assembly module TamB